MKRCSNCGAEKPLEQFQIRKESKDGRIASCKKCLRERDRARNSADHRVAARKEYAQGKGKQVCNAYKIRYTEKNPKKRSVHIKTGNAIRDGKLFKQPCEVCGSVDVHAHHCDYDKPLDIMWLCPLHHEAWHKEHGEALNAY